MAFAEEQSWFGLEDTILDHIEEHNDIKYQFIQKGIWTTQFNEDIHLSQMKTSHIQNCINKCKRERWRTWALPILEQELKRRK